MAYATQADIEAQHGARLLKVVGDRDRDGVIDVGAVTMALDSASAEIDSYLAQRYLTPLSGDPPPERIVQICVDIALYRMASAATALTEEMRRRYEDAIAWLKDVAKGLAQLPPDAGTPAPAPVTAETAAERGKAGCFFIERA